jgi:trehalose 6-phosphate synthase/phosphatase
MQGVSKGQALERLMAAMAAEGFVTSAGAAKPGSSSASAAQATSAGRAAGGASGPDFVLCVGDDRSDEDMYSTIETMRAAPHMMASEVSACCPVLGDAGQRASLTSQQCIPAVLPSGYS